MDRWGKNRWDLAAWRIAPVRVGPRRIDELVTALLRNARRRVGHSCAAAAYVEAGTVGRAVGVDAVCQLL
jgi:hypothetical protein